MEWTFIDENNKLGFGEDAEIEVYVEYTATPGCPPGWEDPGESPDVVYESVEFVQICTTNNETINRETLDPVKRKEVDDWSYDRAIEDDRLFDSCLESAQESYDDYIADMRYEEYRIRGY